MPWEGCWPCLLKDLGLKNNQIECVTFCLPFSSCNSGKVKICVYEERQVHQFPVFGKKCKILGAVLSGQREMDSYLHCVTGQADAKVVKDHTWKQKSQCEYRAVHCRCYFCLGLLLRFEQHLLSCRKCCGVQKMVLYVALSKAC